MVVMRIRVHKWSRVPINIHMTDGKGHLLVRNNTDRYRPEIDPNSCMRQVKFFISMLYILIIIRSTIKVALPFL
jgi:hypothetical protein